MTNPSGEFVRLVARAVGTRYPVNPFCERIAL